MSVQKDGDSAGVQLFDARDGTLQKTLLHRNNAPDAVFFHASGHVQGVFATGAVVWDKDGQPGTQPPSSGPLLPAPVPLSPAIASARVVRGGVQLWNAAGTRHTGSLWLRHIPIGRAAWSPNPRRLATFDGRTLRVWDTLSRRCLRQIPVANATELRRRAPRSQWSRWDTPLSTLSPAIAWSADGRTLVVATTWWPDGRDTEYQGYVEGTPRVFVRRISWPQGRVTTVTAARYGTVADMQFVASGQLVTAGATLDAGGDMIGMLESLSPRQVPVGSASAGWKAAGHTKAVNGLALSPNGQTLAAAGSDASVRLWDWRRGTLTATLKREATAIAAVAWSPDGQRLVEFDARKIAVWDVAQRRVIRMWPGVDAYAGQGNSASWSPDGTSIVVGSEAGGKICNVQTGACQEPTPQHDLLSNTARLWGPLQWGRTGLWEANATVDPTTLRFQKALRGRGVGSQHVHDGNITSADLYDDEKHLVTVGGAGDFEPLQVKIWDVDHDRVEHTMEGLPLSPHLVKAAPNGQHCVVASYEGSLAGVSLQTFRTLWTTSLPSALTSLAWSRDSQVLFAGGTDGRISVMNAQGTLRATLQNLPPRPVLRSVLRAGASKGTAGMEWIAWTPDNTYIGSAKAEQYIQWRQQEGLLNSDTFRTRRRKVLALP
jgi:WD40 repeat protein